MILYISQKQLRRKLKSRLVIVACAGYIFWQLFLWEVYKVNLYILGIFAQEFLSSSEIIINPNYGNFHVKLIYYFIYGQVKQTSGNVSEIEHEVNENKNYSTRFIKPYHYEYYTQIQLETSWNIWNTAVTASVNKKQNINKCFYIH